MTMYKTFIDRAHSRKSSACASYKHDKYLNQSVLNFYLLGCYGKYFGPKGFGFGQALQHTG